MISGGVGNDAVSGGGGDDLFIFADGGGRDVIADFQAGAGTDDAIDLRGVAGVSDFADIVALAVESSGDLLLDFAGGDRIELAGVTLSEIHADDFRFV